LIFPQFIPPDCEDKITDADKIKDAYKGVDARNRDLQQREGSGEFNGRSEANHNAHISILREEQGVLRGLAGTVSSAEAARIEGRKHDVDREIARREQSIRDLHQFARDTGDTRGLEP
jgi:hypothetical protein